MSRLDFRISDVMNLLVILETLDRAIEPSWSRCSSCWRWISQKWSSSSRSTSKTSKKWLLTSIDIYWHLTTWYYLTLFASAHCSSSETWSTKLVWRFDPVCPISLSLSNLNPLDQLQKGPKIFIQNSLRQLFLQLFACNLIMRMWQRKNKVVAKCLQCWP